MAGITKGIDSIDHNESKQFDVKSSLSDVYISNSSTTLDIYVTMVLSLPNSGTVSKILSGIKIPPRVTLNVLETPLKLAARGASSGFRASISYTEPTANTNDLMTVTYTSS